MRKINEKRKKENKVGEEGVEEEGKKEGTNEGKETFLFLFPLPLLPLFLLIPVLSRSIDSKTRTSMFCASELLMAHRK